MRQSNSNKTILALAMIFIAPAAASAQTPQLSKTYSKAFVCPQPKAVKSAPGAAWSAIDWINQTSGSVLIYGINPDGSRYYMGMQRQ